jgi:CRISPR-associated endonuclease Cas1
VEISSSTIALSVRRGIDVVWLTQNGLFRGRLMGRFTKNVALRLAQYRRSCDVTFCLRMARTLIVAKIHQQRQLLLRAQRQLQDADLAESLGRLRLLKDRAGESSSLDSLRGIEGAAAAAYFGQFSKLLRNNQFVFSGRNRRPPRDEINALLSFGYAVLGSTIESELYRCGLDPLLGFFHQPAFGRASLMLDLLEEFRPVVDGLVLRVVNRRQLSPGDFVRRTGQDLAEILNGDNEESPPNAVVPNLDGSGPSEMAANTAPTVPPDEVQPPWDENAAEPDERHAAEETPGAVSQSASKSSDAASPPVTGIGVYLSDLGRKVYLNELFRRMRERLYYPPREASFELRDIVREQIYQLARVVESEDLLYLPFLPD